MDLWREVLAATLVFGGIAVIVVRTNGILNRRRQLSESGETRPRRWTRSQSILLGIIVVGIAVYFLLPN
jgi:uncharacterized membrane protein YidH (DUF202 family)